MAILGPGWRVFGSDRWRISPTARLPTSPPAPQAVRRQKMLLHYTPSISAPLRTTGASPWVKALCSRESEGAETLSVTKSSSAASATGVSPWVSTRALRSSTQKVSSANIVVPVTPLSSRSWQRDRAKVVADVRSVLCAASPSCSGQEDATAVPTRRGCGVSSSGSWITCGHWEDRASPGPRLPGGRPARRPTLHAWPGRMRCQAAGPGAGTELHQER